MLTGIMQVSEASGGTMQLTWNGHRVFETSGLFAVRVDGRDWDAVDMGALSSGDGCVDVLGRLGDSGLSARWSAHEVGGPGVWELGLELRNTGESTRRISRMDPLASRLAPGEWSTLYFSSTWGEEFQPHRGSTDAPLRLECRSGRSSHGQNPWLGLERAGVGLVVSPAWSGNWHIDAGTELSAGISPWAFFVDLEPGEAVVAPPVVIALGNNVEDAAVALTSAVGNAWVPRSAASEAVPVEWNSWWPYEDAELTEEIVWANATLAAGMRIEVSTIDAGWFGASDPTSDWIHERGDWDLVNTARFPSGLRTAGEGIRSRGTKAGIWIEAEAVGSSARVRKLHPEIMANAGADHRADASYHVDTVSLDDTDPGFLGYVCLGSPGGREYVANALDSVVREFGAEWVKLDFNIDPDRGCTRDDHGHGSGDGLLRHYEGLYRVLDDFRAAHPEVILEACSSGGMRLDLGLARHVHCLFLSDPDYTEHHLQVLWGASLMLPPVSMLHFSWSQFRMEYARQELDFESLTVNEFDTLLRAAMLHRFGVSLRLPELSDLQRERVQWHAALFADTIAPFVRNGVLRRLTAQPLRDGRGERFPVFQLSDGDRHIVAAFRLPEGVATPSIEPAALESGRQYRVTDLATGSISAMQGPVVYPLRDDPDVSSWMILIEPTS